jgi:hypothetical protein
MKTEEEWNCLYSVVATVAAADADADADKIT